MPGNVVPFPLNAGPFRELWNLGYHRLLPIIPPDAVLSEHSSIYKVLVKHPDKAGLGKIPGRLHPDGKWRSFPWACHETTEADLAAWSTSGAGVGIKCGGPGGLIGIDVDTLDRGHAVIVRDIIEAKLGRLTVRVGNSPKALYVCRVDAPMRKATVTFGNARVEVLAEGQQFVAAGIHPKTSKPYEWPRGIVHFDHLPIFPPAAVLGLLEAIREAIPDSGPVKVEGEKTDRDAVDQAKLKGDIETVRRAVAAIPNTEELFPLYTDMVLVGEAVHAACIDDPAAGFGIFDEWFSRYDGEGYDLETSQKVWASFRSPHSVGVDFLFELADRHGGTSFAIDKHFENLGEPEPDWAELQAKAQREADRDKPRLQQVIEWIDPASWQGVEPKPREWEVEHWIPKGEVTLLYGDGGIGKTLLAHQYATAAAAGAPWLGLPTRPARVMCFFCEDSADELHRRQLDICRAAGLTLGEVSGNLRIASRKYGENLLAIWDRSGGMKLTAVWERLEKDIVEFDAEVVIIDTIADTFGGSEIDRGQVNAFVKSCLGRLMAERGGSVLALGHPSLSGKATKSGTSGSTAWSNAARSRLFLRYPDEVTSGDLRELHALKLNYGPQGSRLGLRWVRGAFEAIAATMGDGTAVAGLQSIEEAQERAVLDALDEIAKRGERPSMGPSKNANNWYVNILLRMSGGLLAGMGKPEIEKTASRLLDRGDIAFEEVGKNSIRKPIIGLVRKRINDAEDGNSAEGGIFE